MKSCFLNLFGLGKVKFSASIASFIALLVFLIFSSFYLVSLAFLFFIVLLSLGSLCKNKIKKDSKEIVMDEFSGMYLCLVIANTISLCPLLILFVVFRALDLTKPFPFSIFHKRIKKSYAIFLDDLLIGFVIGLVYRVLF